MSDHTPNTPLQRDLTTIVTIVKLILIIAVAVFSVIMGLKIVVVLTPFFMGLILAQLARSMAKLTLKRRGDLRTRVNLASLKSRSKIAYFAVSLFLIGVTGYLFFLLVSQTNNALRGLTYVLTKTPFLTNLANELARLPEMLGISMTEPTERIFSDALYMLQTKITEAMPDIATSILGLIGNFVAALPLMILVVVIMFMCGRFFLTDTRSLYKICRRIMPQRIFVKRTFILVQRLGFTLSRIIGGYFVLFCVTFLESWIAFIIIGLPHPFIWSFIAAFVDILPVLGITATFIPIIIYLLANGAIWQALFVMGMIVVISVVRRLLEPVVLGQAIRLHPIVTIFSMIVGIALWGFSGVVLGPLLFVTLRETVSIFELREAISNFLGDMISRSGFDK